MTDRLEAGIELRLPSGAIVRLVRRERDVWVCEYVARALMRGELELTGAFLRKHGTRLSKGNR